MLLVGHKAYSCHNANVNSNASTNATLISKINLKLPPPILTHHHSLTHSLTHSQPTTHNTKIGIESKKRNGNLSIELAVSYVEIYGDTVTDLLRNGERCGHSKVAAQV